ncbi:MAG: hypothetical protein IJE08_03860, partial [Clostridia bacterium]|nr:hypothetical protein [Clostridia bacterium]
EDDEEEVTFGHRVLGFFKGLIALVLLLLIVVLGLQVAEKGGHISLDWVREKVGSSIPFVNTIFPEPADQGDNMPN